MSIPENSYVLFEVVVRQSPEVYTLLQAGGCMGFVGNLKEQSECLSFENVSYWPLSNSKEETPIELAQEYFNLTPKFSTTSVSQLVMAP